MTTEQVREPVPENYLVPLLPPQGNATDTFADYIAQCEAVVKQCNLDKESIRVWAE